MLLYKATHRVLAQKFPAQLDRSSRDNCVILLVSDTDGSAKRRNLVKTGTVVPDRRLANMLIDKLGINMEYDADMGAGLIGGPCRVNIIDAGLNRAGLFYLVDLPLPCAFTLQELLSIHHEEALLHRSSSNGYYCLVQRLSTAAALC